jgi:uncharacterized membrane protein
MFCSGKQLWFFDSFFVGVSMNYVPIFYHTKVICNLVLFFNENWNRTKFLRNPQYIEFHIGSDALKFNEMCGKIYGLETVTQFNFRK